ncbi:solute carrier organic anion transporter family member 74D-like [Uloborus diversus]|uniref:solute carrier organic anion transporter family member 74D-like n=1 Tax=Uloborus diversus TaxID=327109 RepID=UPI00240A39FC|nr:solute carrier organic anion transporter family member 74D-like [Uloborus diversus]
MLNLTGGKDKNATEGNTALETGANKSDNKDEVRNELSFPLESKSEVSKDSAVPQISSEMTKTKKFDNGSVNLLKRNNDADNSDDVIFSRYDDVSDSSEDTLCGIGSFRPQWIQSLATPKIFLLLFSTTGIVQGMFFAYRMGVISTLEKKYAYTSKVSGSIVMVEEVTPVFLGALLGYYGSKCHRSRVIAAGMFASVFCSYVCALPYFIYGSGADLSSMMVESKTTDDVCLAEFKTDMCHKDGKSAKGLVVFIFMVASFFQGFGTIAYIAVGIPYLDDITKKRNIPIYLAVTQGLRILGPISGFLLSSICLKYYENPLADPGYGPEDPRWIGAWWLGFIVQGTLLFIFTIPMLFFPKQLPGKKIVFQEKIEGQSFKSHLLGFFSALKRLGTNFLCIFLWLNTVTSIHGGIGHFMMLPRYMEQQFRLSAGDASLYSGPPGLIAVILSQVTGGVFIWKFRPKVKTIIIGIIALEFISCAGCLLLIIPRCEKIDLSNNGYNAEGLVLENECNRNCNCSLKSFTPVCGPDGKTTYFSPCFAGCKESFIDQDNKKVYTNCTCVIDSTFEAGGFVTEGYCFVEGCWSQTLLYVTLLPILQIIIHFFKVAYTMILLRSIAPEDKSVCVGTFEMLLCLFGFIPQPVISGALLDSACLIWEKSCGTTGNCWFYDVDKFNYLMHGLSAVFQTVAMLWFFGIYIYQHQLRDFYDDDENEPDVKSNCKEKNAADMQLTNL